MTHSKIVITLIFTSSLNGCGFVAGQLHDKAMEDRLLKPGALDVPIAEVYDTYEFKFLDRYKISHQFLRVSGCNYHAQPTLGVKTGDKGEVWDVKDIYEQGEHTYQRSYQRKDTNHLNPSIIDRYVRSEWQSTDGKGNVRTNKGFTPMCFESWGGSSHVLAIKLYKKDVATWRSDLAKINPNGKFRDEVIGGNTWLVQQNEIVDRRVNTTGGAYLQYTTPIGNTDYTFTIQLGANQDSLKHPQMHARMQEIFRHLIESVKIESIGTDAKP
jgi:hypothetical protein